MKLGVKRGTVKLENCHDQWQKAFDDESVLLLGLFGSLAVQIEHIGSTSIPGLRAKPIIDIAILVERLDEVSKVQSRLVESGYVERVGRLIGRQQVFAKGGDANVTHHLHIIENGEKDWKDKLDFKTILLSDLKARNEYANLKQRLSKVHKNNRAQYSLKKGEFINKLLDTYRDGKSA